MATFRLESDTLHRHQPEDSARNVWQGAVRSLQPMHDRVRVVIDGRPPVTATATPSALAELGCTCMDVRESGRHSMLWPPKPLGV